MDDERAADNVAAVEDGEARVGLFDAGFQHGIGLFETMLANQESRKRKRPGAIRRSLYGAGFSSPVSYRATRCAAIRIASVATASL